MSEHDEIRQMLAALKGLPWYTEGLLGDCPKARMSGGENFGLVVCGNHDENNDAHARFIAAAPVIVGKLLDECERLQKELTRKATKLNDVGFDLNERIEHLTQERDEYTALFNLRRDADRRAIARWQEATGRKAILPDHADLCVWLMDEVQRVYGIIVAEREKAAVVQAIADEMIQRVAELETDNERLTRERDEARAELAKAWPWRSVKGELPEVGRACLVLTGIEPARVTTAEIQVSKWKGEWVKYWRFEKHDVELSDKYAPTHWMYADEVPRPGGHDADQDRA